MSRTFLALLRRIGLAAAGLALVGLAAVTVLRLLGARDLERAAREFEAEVGPLELEHYQPAEPPAAENAGRPIGEAVALLEAAAADRQLLAEVTTLHALNRRPLASWTPEERERVRRLVEKHGEELELLHRAAHLPASSFGLDYAAGPAMAIPPLLFHLRAGDLLLAEAHLAWLEGRHEEALAATEGLGALARALATEPPLIFHMIAGSIERFQHRSIQSALALGGLDEPTLRRLRSSLVSAPRAERFRAALGSEAALLYSVRPGGPAAATVGYDELPYRWLGHRYVARSLAYYRRIGEAYPEATFGALRKAALAPPEATIPGTVDHFAMDFREVAGGLKAVDAAAGLARLALDVALEGAEPGSYPASLAAVGEPGPDPFTGAEVEYRRRDDGSAVLTVPGAEELWREIDPRKLREGDEAPLFSWELAPPIER